MQTPSVKPVSIGESQAARAFPIGTRVRLNDRAYSMFKYVDTWVRKQAGTVVGYGRYVKDGRVIVWDGYSPKTREAWNIVFLESLAQESLWRKLRCGLSSLFKRG